MRKRIIWFVSTDPAKVEDVVCKLAADGRRPEVYERMVSAEGMGQQVLMVIADWRDNEI